MIESAFNKIFADVHEPFSVAMSVYKKDNPEHFDRALESIIIKQTVVPNEIVLVVDGPVTDEINNVIDGYCRMHQEVFSLIKLKENRGLGNALRVAVDNSRYDLIARMDGDDISVSTRFEQQLEQFKQYPNTDIVGGDISEFIGKEDNIVAYRYVPKDDADIKEYLKTRCPMNHVSVMYRKNAVQGSGGYKDLFWNEDYYLWIRMVENGCTMSNTGTVLVNVRVGSDMYKRRGGKKYFQSEKFLQKYLLEHKIIGIPTYLTNILKRWIVQCAMPNWLRGWVFKSFARRGTKN